MTLLIGGTPQFAIAIFGLFSFGAFDVNAGHFKFVGGGLGGQDFVGVGSHEFVLGVGSGFFRKDGGGEGGSEVGKGEKNRDDDESVEAKLESTWR